MNIFDLINLWMPQIVDTLAAGAVAYMGTQAYKINFIVADAARKSRLRMVACFLATGSNLVIKYLDGSFNYQEWTSFVVLILTSAAAWILAEIKHQLAKKNNPA